jgi:crotonobetainyl-CoA:carnitine CoA-transferase CaiB-like acyl-CoA transferase
LKSPDDLARVRKLLTHADVMIQNFRPGVIEKIGLGYETVHALNPRLVYGEVTGYGSAGPWRDKPGQDLLVQSLSGLPYLNGDASQPPVPFGLAVADMMAGAHLVQGVLAALLRRSVSGSGGKVEVSLIESILDFQFEVLTTYLNDGGKSPERSAVNNAHAYLGAPYGIYATADGYLALAMGSVVRLGVLLGCPALARYTDPASLFAQRDEIKSVLANHLKQETTGHWLAILEPADVWCSDVLTWDRLFAHQAFQALGMIQNVDGRVGSLSRSAMRTTRCPIRIDGELLISSVPAPRIGEHNQTIAEEFHMDSEAGKG